MSYKQLVVLAEKFQKLAEVPQMSQQDLGSGELVAINAALGAPIKAIVNTLQGYALQIEFSGQVTCAPNFAAQAVNLQKAEIYASLPDLPPKPTPEQVAAQKALELAYEKANADMVNLIPKMNAVLLKFYRTPAGLAILKVSGTPPSLVVVFKWKLKG